MQTKKFVIIALMFICSGAFCQQKLLTKKIIYTISVAESCVRSNASSDSIVCTYLVNQRFWWEAMDMFLSEWKNKKIVVYNDKNLPLSWDSTLAGLKKKLDNYYGKTLNDKQIQNILENNISKIQFEEEWTYNSSDMLIEKTIKAYCPVVSIDSLSLAEDGLQAVPAIEYPLGWVRQEKEPDSTNSSLIVRNLHYTLPIYNYTPYMWWKSNLEEEYSIPYIETLLSKAEKMELPVYENPDMIDPLSKSAILKRRRFTQSETIVQSDSTNQSFETDTILNMQYNAEDFDCLRFGEQIDFDKTHLYFSKKTNYISPVISIKDKNGDFMYYYPIYYIRKK